MAVIAVWRVFVLSLSLFFLTVASLLLQLPGFAFLLISALFKIPRKLYTARV